MGYLAQNQQLRENPAELLPGARSLICAAMNYRSPRECEQASGDPRGRIARYARGKDYHVVLRELLTSLADELRREIDEPLETRVLVDTAPLFEREAAAAAGIGWVGKNTLVLSRELGSYTVLGEIMTTLDLEPDAPASDHCGSCTRCLDACPTAAFTEPYRMDASRCISYLTIEHRGEIPPEFHARIGDWVFGCDVCQEVCPFNNHAAGGTNVDLTSDRTPASLELLPLLNLRSGEYRRLTKDSSLRRAKRGMFRRNSAVALGNSGATTPESERGLSEAAACDDALVKTAAKAALRRLCADRCAATSRNADPESEARQPNTPRIDTRPVARDTRGNPDERG